MDKPEPFDKVSAEFTTTPFCVMEPTGEFRDHYFNSLGKATRHQTKKGGVVFEVDRETGEWNKVA